MGTNTIHKALRNKALKLLIVLIFIFPPIGRAQIDHWETVVYEDDTWNYLIPTATVPAAWNTLGYNTAGWLSGQGGFGYGDGDDNTTFGNTASCYQRIVFSITDINAIESALFHIDYDDAFVAYLNGVEIARDNITSAGQPPYSQFSDGLHEAQMYGGGLPTQFVISASFVTANLVNGNNVLAIQTHNESLSSSDMSSRAFLSFGITNTSNDYGSTPSWFIAPFSFSSSNLPIVVINTAGAAPIPDSPKIDATMGIIYNGPGVMNYLSDPFNEFDGNIGIERRGSSSGTMFPKKQWGLETRDPSGNSIEVSIFNMAYDNDWVLYAPYSDKSLIRNVLAYKAGWDTEQYAPRTQLCEVMLNGEYQGVYVLTEKIKRKDGKVGLNDVEPQDLYGNELTGDYIFKIDKTTGGGIVAWTSPFAPFVGSSATIKYQLQDPDLLVLAAPQLNYLQNFVTQFETALDGANFADPVLGYAPYIDIESFVDFLLVNELSRNVDGYRISTYLYKQRDSEGGKIVAGPLWDFNLAFGNANYCSGGNTSGWEFSDFGNVCSGDNWQNPFWWQKLVQDPNFTHVLSCRWQELRQGKWNTDSLYTYIDSMAQYLNSAQQRNFQKWPVLGSYVWPNNFIGNTYAEEIDYLKTWIDQRTTWMDANMFGTCADLNTNEFDKEAIRVFPNPAKRTFTIEFPYLVEDATIVLFDTYGNEVIHKNLLNIYSTDVYVEELVDGIYYYRVLGLNKIPITGKLNIIK